MNETELELKCAQQQREIVELRSRVAELEPAKHYTVVRSARDLERSYVLVVSNDSRYQADKDFSRWREQATEDAEAIADMLQKSLPQATISRVLCLLGLKCAPFFLGHTNNDVLERAIYNAITKAKSLDRPGCDRTGLDSISATGGPVSPGEPVSIQGQTGLLGSQNEART